MHDIYVAGELTQANDPEGQKRFYERIADICAEMGFTPYLPHKSTDPITHPDVSAEEVYRKDYEMVAKAKAIIAYVGKPSLGVGIELEVAKNNGTDIILLYHKDDKVSRCARGNPGVRKMILYEDQEDALRQLRSYLAEMKKTKPRQQPSVRITDVHDVYFAGELTNSEQPEKQRMFYEKIAKVCSEAGKKAYLPHQHTDPIMHPHMTADEVYRRNYAMAVNAKLMIAYVGRPSLGTGAELEIARTNNKDVILLFHKNDKVEEHVRKSPVVRKAIIYESEEDALRQLRDYLSTARR